MTGEIPTVKVNSCEAFYILDRFPYIRLRSVLISPLTVTAQPGHYSDQVSVLSFVLFWQFECVTDVRERDVCTPAVQMYVERIIFPRIPMRGQTHGIKLKRTVTWRESREGQRTSAIHKIQLGSFTISI